MTPLSKRVARRTQSVFRVLYNQPRQIVVTLAPGDIIEFREAGRRQKYALAIDTAFRYAVRLYAESLRREKIIARKAKRRFKNVP